MVKFQKKSKKPRRTSVELTDLAWAIKEKHAPLVGLKEVLSAGLVLFDKASKDQQYQAIIESKKPMTQSDYLHCAKENLNNLLVNLDKSHIQLLSEMESSQVNRLRELLGPDDNELKESNEIAKKKEAL